LGRQLVADSMAGPSSPSPTTGLTTEDCLATGRGYQKLISSLEALSVLNSKSG
jgi:hypothetical protein